MIIVVAYLNATYAVAKIMAEKKKIQRFEGDPVHVSTEGFILATAFTFRCVHNYVEDLSCSRKMVY